MRQAFFWWLTAILLILAPIAAQSAAVEVLGKHLRPDGSVYDFKIHDGDALSPGDRFQIVIDAPGRTYYSVIYYSREGEATQLFPLAGARGSIPAGKREVLPEEDNYFTLDNKAGRELMFVVTSPNPLGNIKSALRGSEKLGNSAQEILNYLDTRMDSVAKLEITNTGEKVTGLTDRVSSSLVRDISRTYEANPWTESFSEDAESRKRSRRAGDNSIPDAVRQRAQEVRALLRRPKGAPSSSSLRTVAAAKAAPAALDRKTGEIRREGLPLVRTQSREAERIAAEKAAAEARRLEEEQAAAQHLEEERIAAEKAAAEVRRLEEEQAAARRLAEEKRRQEALAEAARVEAENERLARERIIAAKAAERAKWLEAQRLEAEKAAAEAQRQEEKRLEMAKAEEARRQLEAEQLAAQEAAEEVRRLEEAQELARQAAEEKRLEEQKAENERKLAEQQRLEAERVAAADAAAEVRRLEAEREIAKEEEEAKRLQSEQELLALGAAEEKPRLELQRQQQKQQPKEAGEKAARPEEKKGFLGSIASFLKSGSEVADDEEDAETGTTVAQADDFTAKPAEEEAPPAEAIVVLQAPVRPQPPRLSSPAPVRVETTPAKVLSPDEVRPLYDQVASSIVSINTANGAQAAGFVVDTKGHVLTSWHEVNGAGDIGIQFMGISGVPRSYKANIVRQNKFRDLALLKLVDPPEGIQPITLASGKLPDAGTTVRVFGQKDGQVWATDDAVITRIAQNFTWFSTDNVIHRGEILQVDLPSGGKGIGALVTSMDYKMLGIKSFSGKETGRTYAVSVHSILDFLQPGGQAAN